MDVITHNCDEGCRREYCILAYCAPKHAPASLNGSTPLLLVSLYDRDRMRILIDPDWRTLVHEEDLKYLESLFRDLAERAKEDPLALFKQLSSLSVGPVITQFRSTAPGGGLRNEPPCERFIELLLSCHP